MAPDLPVGTVAKAVTRAPVDWPERVPELPGRRATRALAATAATADLGVTGLLVQMGARALAVVPAVTAVRGGRQALAA